MITIIDYGIGNLRSIEKAFQQVGAEVLRTDQPADLEAAERLVLPGVGAFGACVQEIRRRGLEEPILDAVAQGKPFLGVCIGMQLLFDESEEQGLYQGLGILPGRVVRFAPAGLQQASNGSSAALKVPHMGWNTVEQQHASPLLDGIDDHAFFYFVHSYHAAPEQPEDVIGSTTYGTPVPAIVARNNVFGVQFHPEKSQRNGLAILRNFAHLAV